MGIQTRLPLDTVDLDVLIIGGGIVGAGIARDAAQRGLRTLLVDQADFAAGTSSRSSRLLHGGLRYLAQGKVNLVREASLEKLTLHRIAPHLCQPVPFVFPVWKNSGWSKWQLSLGVRLYDLLCGGRNLGRSGTLSSAEVSRHFPGINSHGLTGATRHFDALTSDARLVMDTLRSAVNEGARVRNYMQLMESSPSAHGWQSTLKDHVSGNSQLVQSRVLINAAGAWGSGFHHSGVRLRLTKGVHLVIDARRLPISEALILTEGKRILFVVPWGERIILGTTDTDFEGDPATVSTETADIDYILNVVNTAFPSLQLQRDDVIATWAGVRPLVASSRTKRGAPSEISRNHVIRMSQPGWFDVAGGKLTTYRRMAEQSVDRIGKYLQQPLPPCRTSTERLAAGPYSGVQPPEVREEVVVEACRQEWAVQLDDLLLRRTSWHTYFGKQPGLAEQTASWMAKELNWSAEHTVVQLRRFHELTRISSEEA